MIFMLSSASSNLSSRILVAVSLVQIQSLMVSWVFNEDNQSRRRRQTVGLRREALARNQGRATIPPEQIGVGVAVDLHIKQGG